ncbi:MAG TPA: winged helix-turn-helix domain-containing protein [Solirubrobacterales bacterium]|nr:winged helix-turn-helix domain-containing protein [Solirubrobacterales bacterium]
MTKRTAVVKRRSIEEAVSYAVGHRIRIEILGLLNEGIRSADQLARLIRQPLSTVTHHIKELLKSNSIEIATVEMTGNVAQHFYRAAEMPFHSDAEHAAKSPEEKRAICALIVQAVMAESLNAIYAGKVVTDPRLWMTWRWFNVDTLGRGDIADEQARHWKRIQEIEAESIARRIESGEEAVSVIVSSFGFERSQTSLTLPTGNN